MFSNINAIQTSQLFVMVFDCNIDRKFGTFFGQPGIYIYLIVYASENIIKKKKNGQFSVSVTLSGQRENR